MNDGPSIKKHIWKINRQFSREEIQMTYEREKYTNLTNKLKMLKSPFSSTKLF